MPIATDDAAADDLDEKDEFGDEEELEGFGLSDDEEVSAGDSDSDASANSDEE